MPPGCRNVSPWHVAPFPGRPPAWGRGPQLLPGASRIMGAGAWVTVTLGLQGSGSSAGLLEAEAPVQHLRGVLRPGGHASRRAAQHDSDQRPAVPDRLEEQAMPGVVGVSVLDPDRALIGDDQVVGVIPPVLVMSRRLRQVEELLADDRPE